jgi:uncharacterized protein (UPF0276 family)
MANRWGYPDLGFGIGLRSVHFDHILKNNPTIDWFEVLSENYLDTGGRPLHVLEQVAERYPVVLHGVSLSVGSTDPVNFEYLGKLKALANRIKAHWISDHLCWTGVTGLNTHDLLPMPYTDQALRHTIERVKIIQDFLERPIALENASTYLEFAASTWPESEFLAAIAEQADCGILLDVNNVYVSSFNHGFDPEEYIDRIPRDRVVQMHLAGHTNKGTHILDTHSDYVIETVWKLYRYAHRRLGGVATLLEWDANIPEFDVVHGEALKARKFREQEDSWAEAPEQSEVAAYGD